MSNEAYSRAGRQTSGMAVGFILFAAIMMLMVGVFQALQGLIGIFENEFYVQTRNYLFQFDATTWGWIHLLIGLVLVASGAGVFYGSVLARSVGVFVAALSAIANFMFLLGWNQPFWSMLIIAMDVVIIWALTAHGRDITE